MYCCPSTRRGPRISQGRILAPKENSLWFTEKSSLWHDYFHPSWYGTSSFSTRSLSILWYTQQTRNLRTSRSLHGYNICILYNIYILAIWCHSCQYICRDICWWFCFLFHKPGWRSIIPVSPELQAYCWFHGGRRFLPGYTSFTWTRHKDDHLSVHLCQSAFTNYATHCFGVASMNPVPNMTPYRSGLPIDAIPNVDPEDVDLKWRTKVYQSIIGCINWLATCTRPDISPALTFLSSYNLAPHHQHYKAAIHALKYLYSTCDYGISFHSHSSTSLNGFTHFPHHHDKEAYSDASHPVPSECHQLTAFSDACWGGQFGNAVPEGTQLELFKFRSLSGYLICCSGGPIACKSICQDTTALSY